MQDLSMFFVSQRVQCWQQAATGVTHPLHPNNYAAQTDQHVYNRWYRYDQQGYCCPRVIVNPDLAIVIGNMPMLYGEVESSNLSDFKVLDRIDQATARILSYTNVSRCMQNLTYSTFCYIIDMMPKARSVFLGNTMAIHQLWETL